MKKNRFPKSVSFNHSNPQDQEILKHIEGVNFSGYVKELILLDIQKRKQPLRVVEKTKNGGIKIVVPG